MTSIRVTPKPGSTSPRSGFSAAASPKPRKRWRPYRWNTGELLSLERLGDAYELLLKYINEANQIATPAGAAIGYVKVSANNLVSVPNYTPFPAMIMRHMQEAAQSIEYLKALRKQLEAEGLD
jgi:hypothetical protein